MLETVVLDSYRHLLVPTTMTYLLKENCLVFCFFFLLLNNYVIQISPGWETLIADFTNIKGYHVKGK